MLLAILLILLQTGTTDLQISLTTEFSERRQIFLWIASFASFAVKVPMVPVHIWLPEAHVEAPTAGSVILAGIPLKLGTHGFLRFSIPMFPEATLCSTPFIYTPSAIAIIYTSLTTSRQIDLKKIIAYSSVAHMNLVTIGMFSRAAAVRSPIFSYGHTRQGQNMCAGRATHQPTSNGGENIACRNKSLIRGVSKTKHCRLFQKQKPLSAPGREWGTALRAGNSSTGATKSESNPSVGFPNSFVNKNSRARSARF